MTLTSSAAAGKRAAATGKAPRIGLAGLIGQGNLGNDGSMEAVLAYLRAQYPDAVIDCLCTDPAVVVRRYDIPAAQLRWYDAPRRPAAGMPDAARRVIGLGLGIIIDALHTLAWVRRHDAVIVPGMGVLETTVPMRPWKTPYWMFLLCASGRVAGTKVALVSVGANVTGHRLTKRLITSAVRLAHYRSYRDKVSRDAMSEMGVDTSRDVVYPDVAYALSMPSQSNQVARAVGIGIMDYSGDNDEVEQAGQLRANYIDQVKRFCRWLLDSGRPVRMFTSDTADDPLVQEIAADARAYRPDLGPSWVVAQSAPSLTELLEQMAPAEMVVATRYHNVLYALLMAKPTLALGYATKHEQLMAEAGLPDFCLPCNALDADQMIQRFSELETRSVELTKIITQRKAEKVRLVDHQLAEMSAVLFPPDLLRR
jgi:polysaccharide pyruvyl transferase WcaK-like protein